MSKRVKDAAVYRIVETLEELEDAIWSYVGQLEAELAAENAAAEPYPPLTSSLERMVDMVRSFGDFVDVEVWNRMLSVADRSTSIAHRRTRDFF